jgi:hypothetical protein
MTRQIQRHPRFQSLPGIHDWFGGVTASARGGPDKDARPRVLQMPARRLLGLVVLAAQRREIALAGQSTAMEWRGVVKVGLTRGPSAAGEGANLLPDPDQVPQRRGRPVSRGLALVSALGGLEPLHRDTGQPSGNACSTHDAARSASAFGRSGGLRS